MFLLCLPYIAVALMLVALYFFVRRHPRGTTGEFVGRHRTRDISFLAQSANGFIGRITRSTPLPRITPDMNDATNPVAFYGLAVLNTINNTVRGILATDSSQIGISGVAVGELPVPACVGDQLRRSGFGRADCRRSELGDGHSAGRLDHGLPQLCAGTYRDEGRQGLRLVRGFDHDPRSGRIRERGFRQRSLSAIKGGGNTGNGTVSAGPTINASNRHEWRLSGPVLRRDSLHRGRSERQAARRRSDWRRLL